MTLFEQLNNPTAFSPKAGDKVVITYVTETKFSRGGKGFANKGVNNIYGDDFKAAIDIMKRGREFNKQYINKFLLDVSKNLSGRVGAKMPYMVFTVTTEECVVGDVNYDAVNKELDSIIDNASIDELNVFIHDDSTFKKRIEKYLEMNPDKKDYITKELLSGDINYDVFKEILHVKLIDQPFDYERVKKGSPIWKLVYGNRSAHYGTSEYILRLLPSYGKNPVFRHFIVMDDFLYEIPEDEYNWLADEAFGTLPRTKKQRMKLNDDIKELDKYSTLTIRYLKNLLAVEHNGKVFANEGVEFKDSNFVLSLDFLKENEFPETESADNTEED